MTTSINAKLIVCTAVALAFAGCGKLKDASMGGFFPELDYEVPETLTAEATEMDTANVAANFRGGLFSDPTAGDRFTVLERWAVRSHHVVKHINRLMRHLNDEAVIGEGSFTGKGPNGMVSGIVQALENDPTYNYEAQICFGNSPFVYLKFSSDGLNVDVTRDFGIRPFNEDRESTFMGRVIYTKSDTIHLEFFAEGTPWKRSFLEDGNYLTEYVDALKTAEQTLEVKGVNQWSDAAPETYAPSGYLTGKIESKDEGEFVAYRAADPDCEDVIFDETNPEDPGFCIGRAINGTERYTQEQIDEAWSRLSSIGIASASSLQPVVLPTELGCPGQNEQAEQQTQQQ